MFRSRRVRSVAGARMIGMDSSRRAASRHQIHGVPETAQRGARLIVAIEAKLGEEYEASQKFFSCRSIGVAFFESSSIINLSIDR